MWFVLVNRDGEPLGSMDQLQADRLSVYPTDVTELRHVLKLPGSPASAVLADVAEYLLTVYKDQKAYSNGNFLADDASIKRYGKKMVSALVVEVPQVWFEIWDGGTRQPLTGQIRVHLRNLCVDDLRSTAKIDYAAFIPATVKSLDLKVYQSVEEYTKPTGATPLPAGYSIEAFGKSRLSPLIVEVPMVWFQLMSSTSCGALGDPVCVSLPFSRVECLCDAARTGYDALNSSIIKSLDLKVYQSMEEYTKPTGATPLPAGYSIERFGKSRLSPLIVEVPMVWLQLMDGSSHQAITSAIPIPFSESDSVRGLCNATKTTYNDSHLKDLESFDLKVYKDMQVYIDPTGGGPLPADTSIVGFGKTVATALIVEVQELPPHLGKRANTMRDLFEVVKKLRQATEALKEKQKKKKILESFERVPVSDNEFQLDNLHMIQESDEPIVATPGLHEFWEGFGGFPWHYFVRMEETVFWQVIKKLLLISEQRIVIVGSPGVGKSCFLMLVAFYLACVEKKKILVIRRIKARNAKNAVVFFDGQGSYARVNDVSPSHLRKVRAEAAAFNSEPDKPTPAIVLVDGYRQGAVEAETSELEPFDILATPCQYDVRQDDTACTVVLPAWRRDDLLRYAKLTDWVLDTGLRKTKRLQPATWPKLVKQQYFYSGGSLREFCGTPDEAKERAVTAICKVGKARAYELVNTYDGDQVDRVRRHYITDCSEETNYHRAVWWTLSVDSGYALSKLGRIVGTKQQLEVYRYAQSIGAGFLGAAYELLLHYAVYETFGKDESVVVKMRGGSEFERIEIRVQQVVSSGDSEEMCYTFLTTLDSDTYWYPAYPFFPFIDAVTVCDAISSTTGNLEKIVAYIHVTIQKVKTFKPARLQRLNEELDKNSKLKDFERAFVVVGPDAGICEIFNLRDAPSPDEFLTMVGCFDPDQQELKM